MSSKKFVTPQKFSTPLFVLNSLDSGTCFFCRRKFGGFGVNSLTAREKQPSCLELVEHLLPKQERGKKKEAKVRRTITRIFMSLQKLIGPIGLASL